MAATTLDPISAVFTGPNLDKLSGQLTEDRSSVRKALDYLLPAIVGSVAAHAESSGLSTLYNQAKAAPAITGLELSQLLEQPASQPQSISEGRRLLNDMIGKPINAMVVVTASHTGIKDDTSEALTGLIGSALLGFVHNLITKRQLSEKQVGELLRSEADTITAKIPKELAAAVPGLTGVQATNSPSAADNKFSASAKQASTEAVSAQEAKVPRKAFDRMFFWFIGLVLLILLILETVRSWNSEPEKPAGAAGQTSSLLWSEFSPVYGSSRAQDQQHYA